MSKKRDDVMDGGTTALYDRKIVAESERACAGSTIMPKETRKPRAGQL
jgi:hypothetical protein